MVRPRRFDNFDYRGLHGYFVTACTFNRIEWFSREQVATEATAHLLRTANDYGFEVTAYCFMPDHLHTIVQGVRVEADFKRFMAMFKQRSAFTHRENGRLWQEGYFEHVIRSEELIQPIAAYIIANPLRAGLCEAFGAYPFLGSSRYTIDQLSEVAAALKGPPHTGSDL